MNVKAMQDLPSKAVSTELIGDNRNNMIKQQQFDAWLAKSTIVQQRYSYGFVSL
jgi:hypothetical protein